MEEIITGCPECLKKPLDHSDNIKTTLVCLVGTWRPVPKGGPGISPTPIFSAMCYLRRTYEKPLCSQNYLLIKVYLSSTRFCLFTSRAGVPPRCAYANHRHHSKLTTCPWMQRAARCQVEWRIYSRGWSVTHWLTSQGDLFFFFSSHILKGLCWGKQCGPVLWMPCEAFIVFMCLHQCHSKGFYRSQRQHSF